MAAPPPDNKRVLLTGAGFSKNWGGRVAREIWEELFSHPAVQQRVNLRMLLIRTPMFEDALAELTDPVAYSDEDRAAMDTAIRDAFRRMDDEHAGRLSSGSPRMDLLGMREFFGWFYPRQARVGYIFSLNQDALVERLGSSWGDLPLSLPGIRYLPPGAGAPEIGRPRLAYPATPDMTGVNLNEHLNYVKLHGSFLWQPGDGSSGMILGGGKEIAIGRSPLLTWAHQLFHDVLCSGDVRLMVFGYSFQDSHINRAIATAVQSFGARMFLWDKADPLTAAQECTHC